MIALAALLAVGVMLLWNAIIPSVVGWGALTYLQSVGLLLLSRILMGRIGSMGHPTRGFGSADRAGEAGALSRSQRREIIMAHLKREASLKDESKE